MNGDLAIRLRAVVKHYGEITAVAGLDLDVPTGTCVGSPGRPARASPRRCACSPARRSLTKGRSRSKSGCRTSRSRLARSSESPAARQPRCDADRRAEPSRSLRTCTGSAAPSGARRSSGRWRWPSRRLCMAASTKLSGWHAAPSAGLPDPSFTVPGSCCSTSRRSASIRRSAGAWALIDALRPKAQRSPMSTHYIEGGPAARGHGHDHVPWEGRCRRSLHSWSPSTQGAR